MKTIKSSLLSTALLFCIFACAAIMQHANAATKTVSFQNGVDGYTGALEVALEKDRGKLSTKVLNIWVERKHNGRILVTERQALIRFDGIFGKDESQVPTDSKITKASLRLCIGSNETATSSHRIYLHRMLVSWNENASWKFSEFGKDGVQADGREAVKEADAHFVPERTHTAYEIDVTESLRAWARGEKNYGWVLLDTEDNSDPAAFISSRINDASRRPKLSISYE